MFAPKPKNNNQEQLHIDNIVNMSLPAKNDSYEITNLKPHLSTLETTLREIQQKGDLEDVIAVIQRVEQSIVEYRESDTFYKILFPVPMMILRKIDQEFESHLATEPFLKYLYKSWKIDLSKIIYAFSIFVLIIALLSLFILGWTAQLIAIKSMMIAIVIGAFLAQIKIFDDTIRNILFTQIYQDICKVIDKLHK